jgi:hypothetical protein
VSRALTWAAITAGGLVLSALFFVAFLAPAAPRTLWGWGISALLGLPLLLAGELAFAFAAAAIRGDGGIPRLIPRPGRPPRVRRLNPGARFAVGAARVLLALGLCGGLLWLLHLLLAIGGVRAQFR